MILAKYCNAKFIVLTLIIFLISCNDLKEVTINGYTMGTTYEVTIKNFHSNKNKLKDEIEYLLNDINNIFSTYINDSEISYINSKNLKNYPLSDEFNEVLNIALNYCQISQGSYDITIGPLVELWGFGRNKKLTFPDKKKIDKILNNIGYKKISLRDNLLSKRKDIKLDLNSLAKGYAVDRLYQFIKDKNYIDILVEIGGEIRTSSNHRDWVVGIQNPENNSIIKKINLNDKSMATSGTYNNYFEYNDFVYSHIINPRTGYPIVRNIISATIIADTCIDADALATLAMTIETKEFMEIINNTIGVDCYILKIDNEDNLIEYMSNNFAKYIIF